MTSWTRHFGLLFIGTRYWNLKKRDLQEFCKLVGLDEKITRNNCVDWLRMPLNAAARLILNMRRSEHITDALFRPSLASCSRADRLQGSHADISRLARYGAALLDVAGRETCSFWISCLCERGPYGVRTSAGGTEGSLRCPILRLVTRIVSVLSIDDRTERQPAVGPLARVVH